jgi:hypothetical protein
MYCRFFYHSGIARMPSWRILDLMPNKPAFDLASVAIKDHYEKQIQAIQNALDRHEEMDSPGKRG